MGNLSFLLCLLYVFLYKKNQKLLRIQPNFDPKVFFGQLKRVFGQMIESKLVQYGTWLELSWQNSTTAHWRERKAKVKFFQTDKWIPTKRLFFNRFSHSYFQKKKEIKGRVLDTILKGHCIKHK